MSAFGVPVIEELEPELDVHETRNFAVANGGETVTVQIFPAQNPSSSTINISCFPPSTTSIIDPCVWAQVTYDLVFTGDNSVPLAPILNIGATDGPRQWPLHQTSTNMQLTLNGGNYTTNPQQWFPVATRMGVFQRDLNTWSSTTPSACDTFQEYYDANNPNQATSIRNSLSDYDGGTQWSLGRSAHPITVLSNTGSAAHVQFTTTERLLCSPLFPNEGGLTGINTMTFQTTMSSLQRVWCHGADPARSQVTGLTVTVTNFELHVRFITPKPSFVQPSRLVLPYIVYNNYPSPVQTLAAGASGTFINTSINVAAIPEKIYVMVKRNDADQYQSPLSYLYTDTCARINSCNINFANVSGILASYSTQDLFHMSCTNGLNLPWSDWYGSTNASGHLVGAGSFMCIDVARDFGTRVGAAPGSSDAPNFNISVNATNFSSSTKSYQMTVLVKYVGLTEIRPGLGPEMSINPLSPADVREAEDNPNKEIHHLGQVLIGGSFLSKLRKAFGDTNKFLKKTKLLSKVGNIIGAPGAITEAASALGYGVQLARGNQSLTGSQFGGARVY